MRVRATRPVRKRGRREEWLSRQAADWQGSTANVFGFSDRSSVSVFPRLEAVTKSAHGFDPVARLTELRAQTLHVHVDRAGFDARVDVPGELEQLLPALHAPAPLEQRHEQPVLSRRQLDRRTFDS